MTTKYPNLTAAQESLFLTLAGRALDSRLPRPFLGDVTSDRTISELEYDPSVFHILSTDLRDPRNKVFELAVRAKRLDEIVRRFVARQPEAVVLDLGAGLDNRMHRIGTPSDVDWYDVDFPEVVALRQQVLPQPANAHPVGVDLRTDHRWLDEISADRPAVIVADGLIPFLSQTDLVTLLSRLTRHFPCGELAFNGYTPLAVWAIKHLRIAGSLDVEAAVNPGFFNPYEPERWGVGLRLVEEIAIARAPEVADLPPVTRLVHRVAGRIRPVSRLVATVVLRYRFRRGNGGGER